MRIETGVDAVEIGRVQGSIQRPGFLERCFSEEERAYFQSRKNAPQTVAGHFAATGLSGFALREVSIRHDERGKPSFALTGGAERLAAGWRLSLSITHTGDTATAFVVAWREETT